MNPGRWEEIEKLYNATLEQEPEKRAVFLAEAAPGDASLRAEVESLLAHRERRGSFLEPPDNKRIVDNLEAYSALEETTKSAHASQFAGNVENRSRKPAPWWMFAIEAIFLICVGARFYGLFVQPENPGFTIQKLAQGDGRNPGATVIASVWPGLPAAKAGLRPGDIIMSSDVPTALYLEADRTYRMEIERKEGSKTLYLTLKRNWLSPLYLGIGKVHVVFYLVTAVLCILASIVAFTRPYDTASRLGALWMVTMVFNFFNLSGEPIGWYQTLLSIPIMIRWSVALIPSFYTAFGMSVCLAFVGVFPRRFFQRSFAWGLVWLPAVFLLPYAILRDHLPIYRFPALWPTWYDNLLRSLILAGWCSVVVVLFLNYRRLDTLNDRRRVRALVMGCLVGSGGALPFLFLYVGLWTKWDFTRRLVQGTPTSVWFVLACFTWAFPVSIAYAILRHRLFDIRIMIRLGLQYAAARGALISLAPIVGAVFVADLLAHGESQPLMQILGHRGWLYALLATGGFLLHARRRYWLDALDRRFFREQYNAQQVLRSVIDEIRAARNFEKVAPLVVSRVENALHPEFAAILMRHPGETMYRALTGRAMVIPPIPASSKMITVMQVGCRPVEFSQGKTGWLNQLPQHEIEFIRKMRIEWLFPICILKGQNEAILAMGPKRSEEPYSREDQELLQAITSSLALLLEESPAAARGEFEECPECGTCYDSGSGSCRREGAQLTPLPFSRMLDRRYRFERRLGEGGMGIVYEAVDMQLERPVAVKLVHPDLIASAEAAARFKLEARAAASFAHPNVVTVYDFGVAEDGRAYLVMELLRGSTLRQVLNHGRLSAKRVSEILEGFCRAVDAAHQQQLLHRDLKPENIFLAESDRLEVVKILDFGLVKPIASTDTAGTEGRTSPGMLLGTLRYMSPEQLRGEQPAQSWDLWALAVVAYEMLTRAHPFDGHTTLDIRNAIVDGRMTPLCSHLPEAPASWQLFFERALSPRLEVRPASALHLLSDFRLSMR